MPFCMQSARSSNQEDLCGAMQEKGRAKYNGLLGGGVGDGERPALARLHRCSLGSIILGGIVPTFRSARRGVGLQGIAHIHCQLLHLA